jgi:hypothetical protein
VDGGVNMNLAELAMAKAVPIEAAGSSKEVAEWVRQGKAILKIVETPWGIEFYICQVEANR